GLLITNHHCGYSNIQSHSSVESDYLTDGFWAMNQEEELSNPGLTVRFLDSIADVTSHMLDGLENDLSQTEKNAIIRMRSMQLVDEFTNGDEFKDAVVRPFFYGKQYFLFIYTVYKDVRLVGAPPSAIGKFGGDTDNWMWPRHTGDFAIFRVYADKNNKPSNFSPDNVPYKPKRHFEISMKGYEEGDFTMVYGYPGSTERYLPSYAVGTLIENELPFKISVRDARLKIMAEKMEEDPAIRIQYASKYAGVSNAWKKWQGMIRGLERYEALEKKQQQEKAFITWAESDPQRKKLYGTLIAEFEEAYKQYTDYNMAVSTQYEIIYASELLRQSAGFAYLVRLYNADETDQANEIRERIIRHQPGFLKNYHVEVDRQILPELLEAYTEHIDAKFWPQSLTRAYDRYEGDMDAYAGYIYNNTLLIDKEDTDELLNKLNSKTIKKLQKDPAVILFTDYLELFEKEVLPPYQKIRLTLDSLQSVYMQGLLSMHPDSIFSPDANGTLRVAYGEVGGYKPLDAVTYKYYTTLNGVIEKIDPDIYDYNVPQKLIDLYEAKDYGDYAQNGEMRVCFVASNHTSGGNSGSPVINAQGQLIGVNFDRNWEGTMSDIMYDPSQCRNITLDIRYALFIIDKFAGAGYLVEEMDLVW
ncbi:MAG: S46 family peptidase, partial [Bacteroidota bacterium]